MQRANPQSVDRTVVIVAQAAAGPMRRAAQARLIRFLIPIKAQMAVAH
jgi:hypothetical protein